MMINWSRSLQLGHPLSMGYPCWDSHLNNYTLGVSFILEAISRGMKNPLVEHAPLQRPNEVYLNRLEKLKVWRKKTAGNLDVESDVVLPRSLLIALAEQGPEETAAIMESSPWRKEHFGSQILHILQQTG